MGQCSKACQTGDHGYGEMAAKMLELAAQHLGCRVSARLGNSIWSVKTPTGLAAKSGTHRSRPGYSRLNGITSFDWASRCNMSEQGQLSHEIRLPSSLHFHLLTLF